MTPIEYRAALDERLRNREAAAVTLHQRIAQLHVELGVENSAITEIKWALEKLGDATGEPSVGTIEPAPARAKRGDVQALVTAAIRLHPDFTAEEIATSLSRKPSQINKTLAALMKQLKVAKASSGGYLILGDDADAREDEAA